MFEYTWVRNEWHGYSWAHVTDDWIFMSTRDGRLNIYKYTWRMTEYDHTSQVTWIFMSTNYESHEYTSQVTWIFMRSTRHGWHDYSWVHVTGDMIIHEYTLGTGDMIIHEKRHGWHDYSWVYVTGDMIVHEYTSRVTNIHDTHHG